MSYAHRSRNSTSVKHKQLRWKKTGMMTLLLPPGQWEWILFLHPIELNFLCICMLVHFGYIFFHFFHMMIHCQFNDFFYQLYISLCTNITVYFHVSFRNIQSKIQILLLLNVTHTCTIELCFHPLFVNRLIHF